MDTKQEKRNNQTSGFGRIKLFFNDLFEQLDEIEWAMDKIKYPQSPLEEARRESQKQAAEIAKSSQDAKSGSYRIKYAD